MTADGIGTRATAADAARRHGEPLLELASIDTYYGNIRALRGVSLVVDRGEIVTLIGANGAGKSTTLRTISGTLKPRLGTVQLEGQEIQDLPAHEIVKLGVAHSPEGRRVFSRMTVQENLQLGAFVRKGEKFADDLARVYDLFPRLKERRSQKAGTLSGGEQQMLAIGRALMARPRILLLDEPSMGLAPILVERSFEIIQQVHQEGVAMLVVEQNANVSLSIADRGYVLSTGRIVLEGKASDLLAHEELRKAYLGR
jgi:branched-chain amino acid transport system ATP-binding protein